MHQLHEMRTCIDACTQCAIDCEACFSHDLEAGGMSNCARINLDCAAACCEAASAMSRGSTLVHQICGHCAAMCDACAEECHKHVDEHCRVCEESCRRCAEECRKMVHEAAHT